MRLCSNRSAPMQRSVPEIATLWWRLPNPPPVQPINAYLVPIADKNGVGCYMRVKHATPPAVVEFRFKTSPLGANNAHEYIMVSEPAPNATKGGMPFYLNFGTTTGLMKFTSAEAFYDRQSSAGWGGPRHYPVSTTDPKLQNQEHALRQTILFVHDMDRLSVRGRWVPTLKVSPMSSCRATS